MSGPALRLWLCIHALWRGRPPLLLPTESVAALLGIERKTLARARREVIAAGLLIQTREAARPGSAGSGAAGIQRAAEWDVPYLHKGEAPPIKPRDERLPGAWRLLSDHLLQIVGTEQTAEGKRQFLTDAALRVLIAIAQGPRTKGGAFAYPRSRLVSVELVAKHLPGLSRRSIERAFSALGGRGLVDLVREASGSEAALYEPAGWLAEGLPWERRRL